MSLALSHTHAHTRACTHTKQQARGKMQRKRKPCAWLTECETAQLLRKAVWHFPKKLTTELPYDPAIPLLGIYPKEVTAGTQTGRCTVCSQQCYSQQLKGGRCPASADRWWMNRCGLHGWWAVIQPWKGRRLTHAEAWVNAEDATLSEVHQSPRSKCRGTPPFWGPEEPESQGHKVEEWVPGAGPWRDGELVAKGPEFQGFGDGRWWSRNLWMCFTTLNRTLRSG